MAIGTGDPWPYPYVQWGGFYPIPYPPVFTTGPKTAQRCPVCEGRGRVCKNEPDLKGQSQVTCHGCSGLGWVAV